MDTVTHALLGAGISDSLFRNRLGPIATPFALLVAAAPDIDVLSFLVSPEYGWLHHRGYTHAVFPILVASPILGWFGWRLAKRSGTWGLWTLLALACLLSHTFLDVATSWGTMPFLPFSNARVSWDLAPIIDIFVFSTLCASFVTNRILRWERVEYFMNPLAYPRVHEHPRRRRAADIVARVVMILFVCYMLIGWHQNWQTRTIAGRELAAAGFEPVEIRAMPLMFTYLSGNVTARDASGNIMTAFYSTWASRPLIFRSYPASDAPAVRSALDSHWGRMFKWYTQNMVEAREEEAGGTIKVLLIDRRFNTLADPDTSRFVVEVDIGPDGRATEGRIQARNPVLHDIKNELDRLWKLTRYGAVGTTPIPTPEAAL